MNDDVSEERIIEALRDGALPTEDLLSNLGIEPGGGELVPSLRRLMEQRIIKRHETFIYALVEDTGNGGVL